MDHTGQTPIGRALAAAAEQRAVSVRDARDSVALEGYALPPQVQDISERYVRGEITLEQHGAQIRALCAKSASLT